MVELTVLYFAVAVLAYLREWESDNYKWSRRPGWGGVLWCLCWPLVAILGVVLLIFVAPFVWIADKRKERKLRG